MATSRRSDRKETTTRKMRLQFSATGEKQIIKSFERVDEAAKDSQEGLEGFRGSLVTLDSAMDIVSTSLGALQTAFDALQVPVGLAVDWEKQFAQIRTLNASIGADLEAQLLDLAARVPQTAGDIAQSAYSAISAGIDPTQVIGFLEAASKAAVAGSSTMAEATTALTKTLAGFKQQGLEAERAMDVLFATVKRGDTNFTDLAASVGMVAGAAGTAGASVEEMGAAIATLSKAAPNTAIAVTNLNAVLKVLTKPTVGSAAAFKKLGVEVGAAAVEQKGLIPILKEISAAVGDDIVKLNSLTNSTEAQAGFNALLSGSMRELLADYEEVKNSTGALNDANAILAQTTQTAIDGFNAMKESALREIGQMLLPDINAGLEEFGKWWEENGAMTIETIRLIYKGMRLMFDVGVDISKVIFEIMTLGMSDWLLEISEAIGLTNFELVKLQGELKSTVKEVEKLAKAQRNEYEQAAAEAVAAVDALIEQGKVAEAEAARRSRLHDAEVAERHLLRVFAKQAFLTETAEAEARRAMQEKASAERIAQLWAVAEAERIAWRAAEAGAEAWMRTRLRLEKLDVEAAVRAQKRGRGGSVPAAPTRAAPPPEEMGLSGLLAGFESRAKAVSATVDRIYEDSVTRFVVFARDIDEQRRAFDEDLLDRRIALFKDDGVRRIAQMQTAHQREMDEARRQGQDLYALRLTQEAELSDAIEQVNKERIERFGTNFRAATAETLTAMEHIAAGAEAIGISGDAAQKALAYTRALVSAADAISYTAQSAASFASFNPFSGFKYGAAAIGAAAAAAAYFKAAGKGGSAGATSLPAAGGGAAVAQNARASEADLGRRRGGGDGSTSLTYQLNFNAPVFDTQGNVDRAIAEAARRQQRAPGGVSILTPREIRVAARA